MANRWILKVCVSLIAIWPPKLWATNIYIALDTRFNFSIGWCHSVHVSRELCAHSSQKKSKCDNRQANRMDANECDRDGNGRARLSICEICNLNFAPSTQLIMIISQTQWTPSHFRIVLALVRKSCCVAAIHGPSQFKRNYLHKQTRCAEEVNKAKDAIC